MVRSGAAQYQQVVNQEAMYGASSHRLIQMLMEGALKRMAEAKGAMQRGDIIHKGVAIGKSISIIGGLRDSLDMDVPGGLSQRLDSLYEYMVACLTSANLNGDESKVDEAAQSLIKIKSAWDAIASEVDA
jgi:flagellar protein FliS